MVSVSKQPLQTLFEYVSIQFYLNSDLNTKSITIRIVILFDHFCFGDSGGKCQYLVAVNLCIFYNGRAFDVSAELLKCFPLCSGNTGNAGIIRRLAATERLFQCMCDGFDLGKSGK